MNPNRSKFSRGLVLLLAILSLTTLAFVAGRSSVKPVIHEIYRTVAAREEIPASAPQVEKKNDTLSSAPANALASGWDSNEWEKQHSLPATPDRNANLAALLEKLAQTDPDRAIAMAQAEGNLKFRQTLIQAVLHGWARTAPLAAANWVLALPDSGTRDQSLSSVFAGAIATSPDTAIATGRSLIQQNPAAATGCGSRLIDALCQAGDFSAAAQFANDVDDVQRSAWLGEAYSQWASFQPEAAAQAAQAINDPQIRAQAIQGIAGGWAESDPAGLAQFLTQLPAGDDRGSMLGQALKNWVQSDPAAAAKWLNANSQMGPDLDSGAAQVATVETLPPQSALEWATVIADPQLRSATVATVLRSWIDQDLPSARSFFQTTTDLLPNDRQRISEVIADLSANTPAQ